jgi:hypothetical protein
MKRGRLPALDREARLGQHRRCLNWKDARKEAGEALIDCSLDADAGSLIRRPCQSSTRAPSSCERRVS